MNMKFKRVNQLPPYQFGIVADLLKYVRFVLVENEQRIKQAIRGVKLIMSENSAQFKK